MTASDPTRPAEIRALHDVADVLTAHAVTDGPPVFTDADRACLDFAWDHGELTHYLTHRAAMRMIRRAEPEHDA